MNHFRLCTFSLQVLGYLFGEQRLIHLFVKVYVYILIQDIFHTYLNVGIVLAALKHLH